MWGKWLLASAVCGGRTPAASPGLGRAAAPAPHSSARTPASRRPAPRDLQPAQITASAQRQIPVLLWLGPWQSGSRRARLVY